MAIWAAATTGAGMLTTGHLVGAVRDGVRVHRGVLRGDPNDGLDVFQAAKQQAAKDTMLGGECYDSAKLQALGNTPADFFDSNYVQTVGFDCAANPLNTAPYPGCMEVTSTPAGDAPLWLSRWREDRPALDDMSAPILIWYGGMDASVTQGRAQCARNKFAGDLKSGGATTTVQYCFDSAAAHRDIIRGTAHDYVNQWIAARGGAGSDPGACPAFPSGVACETPPNDL